VAQDGDLDVLLIWFGTEADQTENVPYNEEDDRASHAGYPARCPSWLLRAAILYLHPSGKLAAGTLAQLVPKSPGSKCYGRSPLS
jgi:hypothetical protein